VGRKLIDVPDYTFRVRQHRQQWMMTVAPLAPGISLARLLDYARERRPAGLKLERHIKAEFLNNSALVCSDVKP
jgi:hypothetical protein